MALPALSIIGSIWSFFGGMDPKTKKVLAVGIAGLAIIMFVDRRATYKERARCSDEKAESVRVAARADAKAGKEALEKEQAQVKNLDEANQAKDKVIDDLKGKVAKLPVADQCRFGPRAGGR